MNIGSYLSTIYNAAAGSASTVYGYIGSASKTAIGACGAVAGRVGQIAQRFIPNFVSNAVGSYPKTFSALAGGAGVLAIAVIASRFFGNNGGASNAEGDV